MKRMIFCLCICAAFAAGCVGPVELDRQDDPPQDNDEGEELPSPTDSIQFMTPDDAIEIIFDDDRPTLYVTGVEYPEGTDWQVDIGTDVPGSKLFLMEDGERIVEVPVGYDNCVSADADMHRCINGHLYTDFSTDTETVIKKDGTEIFRYSGRELIRSMMLYEDRIYTLGIPRSGSGWTFRGDGELISRGEGNPMGGLYLDNGVLTFSYVVPSTSERVTEYYVVINGLASPVSINPKARTVDDIRMVDGRVNYVSSVSGSPGKFLFTGDTGSLLEATDDYLMNNDLKIYYDSLTVFITGSMGTVTGIWKGTDRYQRINDPIAGFTLFENRSIYLRMSQDDSPSHIYMGLISYDWPDGYGFLYENCTAINRLYGVVGMINRGNGNRPALWKNGRVTDYDFNGVFTSAEYQRVETDEETMP